MTGLMLLMHRLYYAVRLIQSKVRLLPKEVELFYNIKQLRNSAKLAPYKEESVGFFEKRLLAGTA